MKTDKQLLSGWLESRDQAALEVLLERYRNVLFRICYLKLGSVDDANDAVQATFVLMIQNAKKLRNRIEIGGWLCLAAKNACRNIARSRKRTTSLENLELLETSSELADINPDLATAINRAVAQLSNQDQLCLGLRFWQNQSVAEVAARLGISEGAAQMRLSRATERLQQKLQKMGVTASAFQIGLALNKPWSISPIKASLPSSHPVAKSISRAWKIKKGAKIAAALMGTTLLCTPPYITMRNGDVALNPLGFIAAWQMVFYRESFSMGPNDTWQVVRTENGIEKPVRGEWFQMGNGEQPLFILSYMKQEINNKELMQQGRGYELRYVNFVDRPGGLTMNGSPVRVTGNPKASSGRIVFEFETDRASERLTVDREGSRLHVLHEAGGSMNSLKVRFEADAIKTPESEILKLDDPNARAVMATREENNNLN